MTLISSGVVAICFSLAALVKLRKQEYEHAFTRLLVAMFYGFLWLHPNFPIEAARVFARWYLVLLAVIEIISWLTIQLRRKGHRK